MRVSIDPVPALRAAAEERANFHHAANGQTIAHDCKRRAAEQFMAGGDASKEFQDAAAIEGLTVVQFASLILSKPDEIMQNENKRRKMIVAIRKATTPQELQEALASLPPMPPGFR